MRRRKTAIFFLIFGISLIALAVALNIGWILLNLREVALMIFGIVFFAVIITGLVLNTIFLLREIKRNEQQDAFLNAMTHELKTPIASIKLYLETLKMRDLNEEKRREFYDVMLKDSNRLLNTVEQVLQASRTKEKNRLLNISEIDMSVLLNESIEIVRKRHGLEEEIKFNEPQSKITIQGDYSELQSVFVNLLDNAVKYSDEVIKISVRLKTSHDDKAEIFIKDNGIGLEPSELKRIFRRFYRAANVWTQKKKGTGLGLFIVQSIVKKHGGKIRVDSKGIGKGTTFIVQLPK
ncbi:MAG TPA: HAMP domain-containing sensor histidine kinase [Pyrinomonadaceae bacterium]|nr:HAMP domain-containing sensor histidine kinase [Pyrinomonadaceae bacterium]